MGKIHFKNDVLMSGFFCDEQTAREVKKQILNAHSGPRLFNGTF